MREWLKEKRITKGYSQRKTALLCGITQQYYNYIESGDRCPKPPVAQKIGEMLDFEWALFYSKDEIE
ncbi:MAG: helix-turn-helix transcriptional regulator [Oscillospiraceae bacterium]